MSDNQSWNSSGSEEDLEPREEPGHHAGVADLSGVLSKVSHATLGLHFSSSPSPPPPPPSTTVFTYHGQCHWQLLRP